MWFFTWRPTSFQRFLLHHRIRKNVPVTRHEFTNYLLWITLAPTIVTRSILFEQGLLDSASELLPLFTWLKFSSWASLDVTDKFLKPTADSNLNLQGRRIFFGYGSSAFKVIPVKFSKFKRIFSASRLLPNNKRRCFRSWYHCRRCTDYGETDKFSSASSPCCGMFKLIFIFLKSAPKRAHLHDVFPRNADRK